MRNAFRAARAVVVAIPACLLALSTPGCSLFAGDRAMLTVTASEPTAQIWINGAMVGTGTVQADVACNRNHEVMVKSGDRVATRTVHRNISTTGVLDVIGGIFLLFPFLGLLGPGFWEPEQEHIHVVLPEATSPA